MWFWSIMGNTMAEMDSEDSFIAQSTPTNDKKNADSPTIKKRLSLESCERDDYGWFEDTEPTILFEDIRRPLHKALSNPPPLTVPPSYILESSLETQQLWYATAGQRPQQPRGERTLLEFYWQENFQASLVKYNNDTSAETKHEDSIPSSEFNGAIIEKGKSYFSNSVSKSFMEDPLQTVTIQISQFRVFETKLKEQYAEFLVLVSIGSHGTVTFGIWKRHSEFEKLAKMIALGEQTSALFKNTLLSWQCMMQRKKWYKCLDKDYLSFKCFLLERFMHDMLFESQTPDMIMKFLGFENNDTTNDDDTSSSSDSS